MKNLSLSVFLVLICLVSVAAQQSHSLYFMRELSQRHQYNPSFVPKYGYFSLPVLGNLQVGGTSNVGLSHFLHKKGDKDVIFLDSSVDGEEFMRSVKPENNIAQNAKIDLLSFGFFSPKNEFWSFDLSVKENLYTNLPKGLFRLAKLALDTSISHYDFKSTRFSNTYWIEAALGYSIEKSDQLRIGGKIKLLAGLSSAMIRYSQFDIDRVDRDLGGWAIRAQGESLLMSNILSFNVDSAGYLSYEDYKWTRSRKPAGYGAAVDFGITYMPDSKTELALSISGLGFIRWNASSVQRGVTDSEASFEGFEGIVDQDWTDTWSSQLWALRERTSDLARFKKDTHVNVYNQMLPTTIRTSAEYTIFKNIRHQEVRLGILANYYYSSDNPTGEFVFALTAKPLHWITLTTTCALLQKDSNRFGLALNLTPDWINFFIASDFIYPSLSRYYLPKDQFSFNLQTGISIPLSKNTKPYRYVYIDKR